MKRLSGLKIGTRLLLGFSTMMFFMLVIGAAGYWSIGRIKADLDKVFSVNLSGIDYLLQAERDLQQLLVAERSMIFANAGSDDFKTLVDDYETNLRQSRERWEKYKALTVSAEERDLIPGFEKARDEWLAVSRQIVEGRLADTRQGRRLALDLSLGEARVKFEEMRAYLAKLSEINHQQAAMASDASEKTYAQTIFVLLVTLGTGFTAGIILIWVLNRGVTRPLREVISGLTTATEQLTIGSGQVSSSSQLLAEGATEQASAIEQTSASIEELASMTKGNAENAAEAKNMMTVTSEIVAKVNTHMDDMAQAIGHITKSSEETGKIIKTIDEIAFQTNLLALNAAVEAARAGEAGAGFAVVADEVRSLAMRAAEAAHNTASLIEDTIKAVHNGSELTVSTQDAFAENVEISGKVAKLIEEIAGASQEQAQGIDQLNRAMSEMDHVVQSVAANADDSASTSETLNVQAEKLNDMLKSLTDLVGGDNRPRKERAVKKKEAPSSKPPDRSPQPALVSPPAENKREDNKAAGQKGDKPEEIIPFDEEDFKDF